MIESVSVKNYQSLHDVTLKLDRFTVIVGPSSSGKSALTRALRTLTGNTRGDSFITHGENQSIVTVKTDQGTVALSRGKKNQYDLIPHEGDEKTFTKLGGAVPEEVSEFLGIPAKDPLNYANQFDMPYLLTASAADVARTLGELTNVSVIFEAAREANRRRLQASGVLKTRQGDHDSLSGSLDRFRGLSVKSDALDEAEELLERVVKLRSQIEKLTELVTRLEEAEQRVTAHTPTRELPDIEPLREKSTQIKKLRDLLISAAQAHQTKTKAEADITTAKEKSRSLTETRLLILRDAGHCPTCGQGTAHLHE